MKKITLNDFIDEQRAEVSEFDEAYQKELLINVISKMVVELRNATQPQCYTVEYESNPNPDF